MLAVPFYLAGSRVEWYPVTLNPSPPNLERLATKVTVTRHLRCNN
jgi:hypothetical protein